MQPKVVTMDPHQHRDNAAQKHGYSAGNPSNGISTGKAILISAVSAVTGAFLIRLMDRTVFRADQAEIEGLKAQLAEQAGPQALAAARPAASPAAMPPPGYVRIDVPRQTMTEEFWRRLAGEAE